MTGLSSTIKSRFEFRVSSSRLGRSGRSSLLSHLTPDTRHSTPCGQAGFTLLELIAVLFIIAMAAALVGPSIGRSFGQVRLKAAARDLAAVCRFARVQAISHQGVIEVVLDRRTNTYWLRGPDRIIGRLGGIDQAATAEDPEQPWLARMRQARIRPLPQGLTLRSVVLSAGSLREDEHGTIAFFPQGSSTGGEIEVSDEKGRAYRIVVDPAIGIVRIHAGAAA